MMTASAHGRSTSFFLSRMATVGVLLLAAGLRWMSPGLVAFKFDEAHIFGMAQGIATGRFWPLLSGGTSIGAPRSALDAYILAPPLVLTGGSPQAAVLWLGMLGVLAVALTYLLGRLIGGEMTGLLAALYMAANPWLAFYDRKLWAHIQVVFSVLLLLLAWRVVVNRRERALFWFPVAAALQLLAHVLALVQVLSWLGAFAASPRRWLRRRTLWGLLAGLTLMSPYLWALGRAWLAAGGGLLAAKGGAALAGGAAAQSLGMRWALAWQLFGADRIFELTGAGQRSTGWDQALWWGRWVTLFLIALGFLRVVLWLRDERRRSGTLLLLFWGLGPVLALSFGPLTVYLQYWTALLPLPAIFFALALSWPLASAQTRFKRVSARARFQPLLILFVALALLILWGGAWRSVLARIETGAGRQTLGRPLSEWQAAAMAANLWADKLAVEQVKVLVHGVDPGQDGEPAAIADLIGNPPYARFLNLSGEHPALLLHAEQPSLYLSALPEMTGTLEALGEEVWRGDGPEPLRLYLLPSAPQAGLPVTRLPAPRAFDVGMALTGYAFPQPWPAGERVLVTLVWRVLDPPAQVRERDFTAFNHVVRAGTADKVAQVDGLALLSRDWWPGDVLYQGYWMTLPAPGEFEWLTGLYSRTDGGRAQLDARGDTVRLPVVVR